MVYFFVCYHWSRTAFCSELWYWVVIIYVFLVIPNPTVPIHHWSFLLHDEKIASIIGITWELHEVVHNVIPRRNNHLLCSLRIWKELVFFELIDLAIFSQNILVRTAIPSRQAGGVLPTAHYQLCLKNFGRQDMIIKTSWVVKDIPKSHGAFFLRALWQS